LKKTQTKTGNRPHRYRETSAASCPWPRDRLQGAIYYHAVPTP
jgi:hypothetical protein